MEDMKKTVTNAFGTTKEDVSKAAKDVVKKAGEYSSIFKSTVKTEVPKAKEAVKTAEEKATTTAKETKAKVENLAKETAKAAADTKKKTKVAAKKAAQSAEKTKTKAQSVVKEAAKTAEKIADKKIKTNVNLQFAGRTYSTEELIGIAKDVWKYDLNQKASDFKTVDLYVKPEENKTYYVINGEYTGSFFI